MTVKRPVAQEAAWLSTLHPSDRKHAQRWLKEVGGEGRLRRIAHAFNKAPAAAHRPQGAPLALLDRALVHAAHLYVTTPNLELGKAAGQTREHFAQEIAAGNTTAAHFRRKLSDALKARPEAFYQALAGKVAASGQIPRADLYPGEALLVQSQRRVDVFRQMVWPVVDPSLFEKSFGLPKKTADAYTALWKAAERGCDLTKFADLFSLPDHLPVSVVAAWFDAVREHLAREQDVSSE